MRALVLIAPLKPLRGNERSTCDRIIQEAIEELDANRRNGRILLVAHHVSPYKGSEPGLGWGRALQTARFYETWVICKGEYCKPDIERFFAESGPIEGLHFVFLYGTRVEKILLKIPGLFFLAYYNWFRRAYRKAVELHEEIGFNVLHQVNWVTYREPGYPWKLDIPFVWGPFGGMENAPWRFLPPLGAAGAIREGLRNAINSLMFRFSPRFIRAARHASALLVSHSEGKELLRTIHGIESTVLTPNCVPAVNKKERPAADSGQPLRVLWSSRCLHRKGLPLLIEALKGLPPEFEYELRILGVGPQQKRWQRLCKSAGINQHCTWLGWLPRDQAVTQFEWADVFVFTSLRDVMAVVVLEALSFGVPVICLDHSGSSDAVTDACGIKLAVTNPARFYEDMRRAILLLSRDRERLRTLSAGALQRAREYLWSTNGETMARIYSEVQGDC